MTESWGELANPPPPSVMWWIMVIVALSYIYIICALTGWWCCLVRTTLEMYLVVVKKQNQKKTKVGHWNHCRNIIAKKQATNKKPPSPLLFQYTMKLIYRKETDETTHISKMAACMPCACAKHGPLKHAIKNWFPQFPVSFCWESAREDFCGALISESDIWDDCGHSPDQGRRLGQKQS